jgi:hypothetical protein
MVLARLAGADDELARRALRRHRAWRDAVQHGVSPRGQRALRRAWERSRDEALIALSITPSPPGDASARAKTAA